MRPLTFIPGANIDPETVRRHIGHNVRREAVPWLQQEPVKDGPLSIVGGGPSLSEFWPELYGADILALNNAYGFLCERDIIPQRFMLLDARRENIDFLFFPPKARKETTYYLAAQAHPDIFDRLDGFDVRLYLTNHPDTPELIKGVREGQKRVQIGGTVGTVGMKALCLGYALGYREFRLYGFDSSYRGEMHHAFKQKLNESAKTIEVFLGDKRYIATPSMAHQATEFPAFAGEMVREHGCDITLRCTGLLPDMVAAANERGEVPLAQREMTKYAALWQTDTYRKYAPGEFAVNDAVDILGIAQGDTLADFGCGTGRATAKFAALGYQPTGIDFAENALDTGVAGQFPFQVACLWELPDRRYDWGYCTDVMEHIPSEKVDAVIAGIARSVERGAYFRIATTDDVCGGMIGFKLHMTIMGEKGWREMLERHFNTVETISDEGGCVTFAAFHNDSESMRVAL